MTRSMSGFKLFQFPKEDQNKLLIAMATVTNVNSELIHKTKTESFYFSALDRF